MIAVIVWEFLFCLFDAILLMKFCELFLDHKKDSVIVNVIGVFMLALFIFLLSYIPGFSYVSSFMILFFVVLFSIIMFQGELIYKIVIAILFQVIYSIYSVGSVSIIALMLGDASSFIYEYNSPARILFIIVTRSILFFLFCGIAYKKNQRIRLYLSNKVIAFLCVMIVFFLIAVNWVYQNPRYSEVKDIYLLILGIVIFSFIFFIIYKMLLDEKTKRKDLEIQKQVLEMEKEDYDHRMMLDKEIRKMKHDLKNQLISVESLVKDKKYEEAEKYLNKLSNSPALKKVIDSGNSVIDALINVNIQRYKEIDFHVDLNIMKCDIDSDVLAIIFGNIMDNAIEATLENLEVCRDIFISIHENETRIVIKVENGFQYEPKLEGVRIVTLKRDCKNHGLGIQNIEEAAKRYQGQVNVDIDKKEKMFRISVLLMKS